jgi:hypothetical protein
MNDCIKMIGYKRVLVGRPEGMGPLERNRRRWEDNIKINLQELGWGNVNWIDVASDRRWQTLLNANEPSRCIKCGEILD